MKSKGIIGVLLLLSSASLLADSSKEYVERAKAYIADNDHRSGIIELKNALQKNPKSIDARLTLGTLYLSMGDGAAAQKELERAKKLNAERGLWAVPLAQAYLSQNDIRKVLRETENLDELEKEIQHDLLIIRGEALLKTRQIEEASAAFDAAGKLSPESDKVLLGKALGHLASNQADGAKQTLDLLLNKYPDNVRAYTLRGNLLARQKERDLALQDFDSALNIDPNNIPALLGRATIYLGKNQPRKARADIELLDTMVPGYPQQNHMKATLAYMEKKYDEAERHLQEVLRIQPNYIQSQMLYGIVSYHKGEYQTANEYLTKVHQVAQTNLSISKLLASVRNKLNKNSSVITLLEPVIQHHPQDAQLKAMLGSAYMKAGRFDEGSTLMDEAIKLAPELASYRTQLALGLLAQGKTGDAIDQLQSTVDMGQDFIQADVLLVLSHLRNKQTQEAIKASENLQKRQPNSPIGFNLSGLSYMLDKNTQEAEKRFLQALQVDPKFTPASINLARLAHQNGNHEQARRYLEDALEASPEHPKLLMSLAEIAKQDRDKKRMFSLLNRAMQGKPSLADPGVVLTNAYLQDNQPLKALKVAGDNARKFPAIPAVLDAYGRAQMATGDAASAAGSFQQIVRINENLQTLTLLATAQTASKQYSAARTSFQRMLELKSDHIPAQLGLIELDLQEGKFSNALKAIETFQKAHPNRHEGYHLEGLHYAMQSQHQQAISGLEKAHELKPSSRLAIQLAQQHIQSGNTDNGIAVLQGWTKQAPNDIQARVALSMTLQRSKQNQAAIQSYEEALKLDKDNVLVLNNLAWLYATQNSERAIILGERAYRLASKRAEIVDTYGWILVQNDRLEEGVKVLKEANQIAPDHQEISYHLGYAYAKQGKTEEARIQLTKAMRLAPDSHHGKLAKTMLDKL